MNRRKCHTVAVVALLFLQCLFCPSARGQGEEHRGLVSTFSIAGRDSRTAELGIAAASRFFAVGSVVPWAKADIGAVATQSFANTSFGWRGLELLEKGVGPKLKSQARHDADLQRLKGVARFEKMVAEDQVS